MSAFLLLLEACDRLPADAAASPDTSSEATDTADTGHLPDTADTADTADTGETGLDTASGDAAWTGRFFDAPDVRIRSCGSLDRALVVAVGPDLDGDGLAEVAVGSPEADGDADGEGRVYLLRGADLASGTADLYTPMTTVLPATPRPSGGLGTWLDWIDDRDGDGLAELRLWHAEVVPSGDLAGGGEVVPTPVSMGGFGVAGLPRRWDDIDGDGRADWVMGDASTESEASGGGGVYVAGDVAFGISGVGSYAFSLGGDAVNLALGDEVLPLDVDLDGDGVRELYATTVAAPRVLSSAAILASEELASAATLGEIDGLLGSDEPIELGDVDGDGLDDLAFLGASLCALPGSALSTWPIEATCLPGAAPDLVSLGGDVDGDGDVDVWIAEEDTVYALDGTDLIGGTRTVVRTLPTFDLTVSTMEGLEGGVWVGVPSDGWAPKAALWRLDDDGDVAVTVNAGSRGAEPGEPWVHDVDGDGLEDLVFRGSGRVWILPGDRLADGGELNLCDDATSFDTEGGVFFLDDEDGDGVGEVDLIDDEGIGPYLHRVVDGATLLGGGGERELRHFTAGHFDAGDPTCRSGPGGALVYGGLVGGSTIVYDGDVTRSADPAAATLGGVDASPLVACAPDLDGDGREELVFGSGPYDEQLGVVFAASLAPGDLIDPTAEGLRIASGDPVVAGSLGDEDVWVFEGGSPGLGWYVPTGDGTLGAFTQAAPIESVGHGWLDPVIGGPEPDLVVHGHLGDWEYGFYGVDGAHPGEAVLLVPTVPHENELWDWDAGAGPDVFGAGVDSFWVRYRPDATMRPVVEFVAARPL